MENNFVWLEGIHTMWNASAISAKECTAKPTPSSRRKKRVSSASITLMRVDLDHPILGGLDVIPGCACSEK